MTSTEASWVAGENSTAPADPDPRAHQMEIIGYAIVVPAISSVGVVFNIINLIVLSSRRLAESTYTYLTGLAVADLLSLFFFGVNCYGRGMYPQHHGWRVFEAYVYWPLGTITTVASVLLTVTVTVERFIFIYLPLRARTWCVPRIARLVTLAVWLVCLMVNIPRFFIFRPRHGRLEYTALGKTRFYTVYSWLHLLVISFGSAIILIVFNILLILGIQRTHKRRSTMTRGASGGGAQQKQDETRLTKTLIGVIFLFIVGEIPSALTSRSIVVNVMGQGNTSLVETFAYKVAVLIATILVVGQLSLNFIIYCVFNRKFWAVLTCMKASHGGGGVHNKSSMTTNGPRHTDKSCNTVKNTETIALQSEVDDDDENGI